MSLAGRYPASSALVAGLLMPLAFSPFDLFFVTPLALGWLFLVWLEVQWRQRLLSSFLFGCAMFGAGVSWVYISLSRFGEMPVPLALASVAGFIALLALYPVLAAALAGLAGERGRVWRLLLVFPVCWTGVEILRTHLFTGFSWLESGYSQVATPLGHWASVLGVHGVSFLTAVCAGLVACTLATVDSRRLTWLLLIAVPFAGGWILSRVDWTEPAGAPISAALVQGAVPLSTKWDFQAANQVARRYIELSRESGDVDVIIWPESPLPFFIDQMGPRFYDELLSLPAPVLSGFLERIPNQRGFDYYNSAILFTDPVHVYRKTHLVPFGEYTPLPWLFEPVVAYLDVPMSVLTPWREPQFPIPIAGRKAGISICYEDAFARDIRRFAPDSEFLVNITEDAWFGDSLAPFQRLQMARMRTLETGRPMLRSSNTGLAAAIDHRARLLELSPQFEEGVVEVTIQPRTGLTPYVRHGDYPVVILLMIALLGGILGSRGCSRRRVGPADSAKSGQ